MLVADSRLIMGQLPVNELFMLVMCLLMITSVKRLTKGRILFSLISDNIPFFVAKVENNSVDYFSVIMYVHSP